MRSSSDLSQVGTDPPSPSCDLSLPSGKGIGPESCPWGSPYTHSRPQGLTGFRRGRVHLCLLPFSWSWGTFSGRKTYIWIDTLPPPVTEVVQSHCMRLSKITDVQGTCNHSYNPDTFCFSLCCGFLHIWPHCVYDFDSGFFSLAKSIYLCH